MSNWIIRSADCMKITQDTATNPPSASHIDAVLSKAKDLGCTHIAISVPYDLPNGGGDVIAQTQAWTDTAKKYGLNIFHRHSWCSDQGWYGVAQDTSNDRIQDTVNWIKAHPTVFQNGDIFTPKPEPSNMGIAGQDAPGSTNRFPSVAAFNTWLRDMRKACQDQFDSMGLNIKVGFWGFDGFVLVGYNNPDHQGTSLLEPATVTDLGNLLAGDHYPSTVGKPMTDFLNVFHQVWPGVEYFASEIGSVFDSADPKNNPAGLLQQLNEDFTALSNDSLVVGTNYWVLSDNDTEALLDPNLAITPLYTAVQGFYHGSATPTPTPVPPTPVPPNPTPTPPSNEKRLGGMNLEGYCKSIPDGDSTLDSSGVWHCSTDNKDIDLTAACQWEYKDQNAHAIQERPGDPYSYACYTPIIPPTPIPPVPVPPTPTVPPAFDYTFTYTGKVEIVSDGKGNISIKYG